MSSEELFIFAEASAMNLFNSIEMYHAATEPDTRLEMAKLMQEHSQSVLAATDALIDRHTVEIVATS